jgi:hypothetical protein
MFLAMALFSNARTVDVSARPVENLREAMAQDRFLRDAQKAAEKAQ